MKKATRHPHREQVQAEANKSVLIAVLSVPFLWIVAQVLGYESVWQLILTIWR